MFQHSQPKSQITNYIRLGSWSVTVAMAIALLGTIPAKVTGQSQPPQSAEQSAALDEAKQLDQQAFQLYKQGKYSTAISLLERSLAILEKTLGKEHPDVATSLDNLAQMYRVQKNYQQAESLFQRSLAIFEKTLGKEHRNVANSLNNLALLYEGQGSYQKAEILYQRSLAIWEKALGKEHPLVAVSLNNLALLYFRQSKYQKAEPLYQRSLAIREKVLGTEHSSVATSLNNLAELYREQGSYQKAEPLYQRSLAIREKVSGTEHPDFAGTLNNLALLYFTQGNYQKAELLYQRSLAIREKVLGTEHPNVANSLHSLAELYREQGSYQKSEPLYQRSLAIIEKVLGKEHPLVTYGLDGLATLLGQQGSYQKAELLYQRSLTIREKVLGNVHTLVAISLNNLAVLYRQQGNYQKAELLHQRSLAIREKVLGNVHPLVATSLNNLAALYFAQGNSQKAELLYQRSLVIQEKVLGNVHPSVATSLNNLADLYRVEGDITRATDFFTRGLAIQDHNLTLIFAVGSEQRKQDYARTFIGSTDRIISLLIQKATNNPKVVHLALTTVLRRKGLVLDAVADSVQILRSQLENNPETKKLFDEWLNVQQQQSALVFREQGTQTAVEYKNRFEKLEAERQRLEGAISAISAEFRTATQPVELATIQAKIPQDAALVEIVQYRPLNAKAKRSEQLGKPRYAAAVLLCFGEPKWVDLGDAATIDKSVASLRTALAEQHNHKKNLPEVQQLARALDEKVMTPIRPILGNARHLLLSPEGQLTLIPFEALRDQQGQYLIQRYALSYLSSGRDLLRFQSVGNSRSGPVVFADVDYDQQETVGVTPKSTTLRSSQNLRSIDLVSLDFLPLPATREEEKKIKEIFPNTKVLRGKQATETALKQLPSPSILHLATHGFFLPNKPEPEWVTSELEKRKDFKVENPLLRSGLALAGFNNRHQAKVGSNDGVLTALEVAGLDLRGTQLVVLSACETGLGDINVGDGVYGLRRALAIAGSQSQILSLWKVSDEETKDLMVNYYQGLKAGKGRHEALRTAQLELLSNPEYQHPYYWASFVPSGNWTPLNLGQQR